MAPEYQWHIRNPKKARQLLIFDGTSTECAGVTDIDGIIEYKNKGYVIYEIKTDDTAVPLNQRITLERMVQDFMKAGKRAIAIVGEHSITNPNKSVPVGECIVRRYYFGIEKPEWHYTKRLRTVKELTDEFLEKIKNEPKRK